MTPAAPPRAPTTRAQLWKYEQNTKWNAFRTSKGVKYDAVIIDNEATTSLLSGPSYFVSDVYWLRFRLVSTDLMYGS